MTQDGDLALLEEALGGGNQARHRQSASVTFMNGIFSLP
jgi:hypothetical protein